MFENKALAEIPDIPFSYWWANLAGNNLVQLDHKTQWLMVCAAFPKSWKIWYTPEIWKAVLSGLDLCWKYLVRGKKLEKRLRNACTNTLIPVLLLSRRVRKLLRRDGQKRTEDNRRQFKDVPQLREICTHPPHPKKKKSNSHFSYGSSNSCIPMRRQFSYVRKCFCEPQSNIAFIVQHPLMKNPDRSLNCDLWLC